MKPHLLSRIALAVALALAPLACSRHAAPGGTGSAPNAATDTGQAASGMSTSRRRTTVRREQPPAVRDVRIPAGTRLAVRLDEGVSSASASAGEVVAAELAAPLEVDGEVVAAAGTPVEATVESVTPSGRLAGRASLALALTAITIRDQRTRVATDTLTRTGPAHTKRNERMIGAGAVIGALAGQLLGGHTRDTLRGAAVGAAAGTGVAAAHGRLDVTFPAGQVLPFSLQQALVVAR